MERFSRLAPDGTASVDAASRVVRYTFSDESVGRDGHIVKADAWRVDNFKANPVFLWCHQDEVPPIGRVFDLNTQGRKLLGAVKYAETEFAETIFELVRNGYLSGTSTSWQPIKYEPRSGFGVGGGVIFTDVDLLEISQVSVPALPTALASARSRGINLRPLADWAERAIAVGNFKSVPRPQLEAIHRAAAASVHRPRDSSTLAGRMAIARDIQQRGRAEQMATVRKVMEKYRRHAIAELIRDGMSANDVKAYTGGEDFGGEDLGKLGEHLHRAVKQHERLGTHHAAMSDQVNELRGVHRALTSTLDELEGAAHRRASKALGQMADCQRMLRKTHEDATKAADSASDAVDEATDLWGRLIGDDDD